MTAYSRARLAGSLVALALVLGLAWGRVYELTVRPFLAEAPVRLQRLAELDPSTGLWWRYSLSIALDVLVVAVALIASVWVIARFAAEAGEAGRWKLVGSREWVVRFTPWQRIQYLWGLAALVAVYAAAVAAHLDLAERSLLLQLHVYAGAALGLALLAHILYYGALLLAGRRPAMVRALGLSLLRDFAAALTGRRLPSYGAYDVGQVVEYWILVPSLVVAGLTGLALAVYGPAVLDGVLWVVHWRAAIIATTVFLIMHVGYDHLRPRVFPVDTSFLHGRVPVERAREEYPDLVARLGEQRRKLEQRLAQPSRS